jgi:hypothetical protein
VYSLSRKSESRSGRKDSDIGAPVGATALTKNGITLSLERFVGDSELKKMWADITIVSVA